MRGLEIFSIVLGGMFVFIILFSTAGSIIWYATRQPRMSFVTRMRKQWQERHPYFKPEKFTPIITERSGCCQAMLWEILYNPPKYYCDKCGKENMKSENGFVAK